MHQHSQTNEIKSKCNLLAVNRLLHEFILTASQHPIIPQNTYGIIVITRGAVLLERIATVPSKWVITCFYIPLKPDCTLPVVQVTAGLGFFCAFRSFN